MKRVLSVFIILAVLNSCKSDPQTELDGYAINGTAPGIHNGVRTYLKTVDNQRREIIQDSAIIVDEKFTFKGEIDTPQLWHLTINSVNGSLPIVVETKEITITVDPNHLGSSTITGSKSNDALSTYLQDVKKLNNKRNALFEENKALGTSKNTSENARIAKEIKDINQQLADYPQHFISEHPDNYFSLVLLESLVASPNMDLDDIGRKLNAMSSELKSSEYGKRIASQLETKKLQMAQFNALNIGNIAPDFSAPDPDGNTLTLSSIREK